MKVLQVACGS
jgi:hypothetical protein